MSDLINYLKDQPDDFVIYWYTDAMDPDQPWDASWVDVMFEDRLAWVITSGLLEDDEDEFIWPPDMVAHLLIDPTRPDPFVGWIPTWLGEPVDDEVLAEVREIRSQFSDECYWMGAPAWSAAEISRAIEDWCMRHVGRPLQARWDSEHGPSPQAEQMLELVQAMKDGIEPKYLISPGEAEGGTGYSVYASEQVMEVLMQAMTEDDDDD